jgi:opacity protein-like surface antigen
MRTIRTLCLAGVFLFSLAAPALADITGFIGANMTPANRETLGGAVGISLLVVGFEFEYAFTPDDPTAAAPSLKTGTANILLQTPLPIAGFQPYVIAGAGVYNESLGAHSDTSVTTEAGGGVKVTLIGPLALRVDYRVFKLGSGALYSPAHRIYAGLNLKF